MTFKRQQRVESWLLLPLVYSFLFIYTTPWFMSISISPSASANFTLSHILRQGSKERQQWWSTGSREESLQLPRPPEVFIVSGKGRGGGGWRQCVHAGRGLEHVCSHQSGKCGVGMQHREAGCKDLYRKTTLWCWNPFQLILKCFVSLRSVVLRRTNTCV